MVQGMGRFSGDVGDGAAEGREDGDEGGEGVRAELARALAERGERLREQAGLEPRPHAGHGGDVAEEPLRLGASARRRARRSPGRRRYAPPLDHLDPAGLVRAREDLLDEPRRLPEGHPGARHDLGGRPLVATWQPGQGRRRAWREEPEPDVRLHRVVEPLRDEEPPGHPALVPREPPRDLRLREVVLPVQRANEPRLLELGETAALVEQGERDLRAGHVHGEELAAQLGPAERPRRPQPLEAVEHLEAAAVRREHGDRRDLAHARERPLHPGERVGLAQPQGGEPLPEHLHAHRALRRLAAGHGAHLEQMLGREGRLARDRLSHGTASIALSPSVFRTEGGA